MNDSSIIAYDASSGSYFNPSTGASYDAATAAQVVESQSAAGYNIPLGSSGGGLTVTGTPVATTATVAELTPGYLTGMGVGGGAFVFAAAVAGWEITVPLAIAYFVGGAVVGFLVHYFTLNAQGVSVQTQYNADGSPQSVVDQIAAALGLPKASTLLYVGGASAVGLIALYLYLNRRP